MHIIPMFQLVLKIVNDQKGIENHQQYYIWFLLFTFAYRTPHAQCAVDFETKNTIIYFNSQIIQE